MEENETTDFAELADEVADAPKTHLVVGALAVIGGVTVAKKAFNKVRGYRIVRKTKVQRVEFQPEQTPES